MAKKDKKKAAQSASLPGTPPAAQPARACASPKNTGMAQKHAADIETRFLLEQLLGSGGICEVHAALDLRRVEWGDANPKVAVKRLCPELQENPQARLSLAQEFCVLRHLAHPGVVRVFDLHKEPFGICFTMELLEGRTLQQALLEYPAGLNAQFSPLLVNMLDALRFLHQHGVVHGDIKPSNIFLAPEGRVALIDFNVATATAQAGAACSPVTRGLKENLRLPSYSLRYASPERLRGGRPTMPDDIFSACCTIYEAISGTHPFGSSSAEAEEAGLAPRQVDFFKRRQWNIIRQGLNFNPEQRPQAEELFEAFNKKSLLPNLKKSFRARRWF